MKKIHSLGVTRLVFISSLATCKTTVSEALIRECDRSACDHKHHCQDTWGLIFSVGMGTQACSMVIKMLLCCPAGSRTDRIPHEKAGSHVTCRLCFSYCIIWHDIRDRAQSCSERLGNPLVCCSWSKLWGQFTVKCHRESTQGDQVDAPHHIGGFFKCNCAASPQKNNQVFVLNRKHRAWTVKQCRNLNAVADRHLSTSSTRTQHCLSVGKTQVFP